MNPAPPLLLPQPGKIEIGNKLFACRPASIALLVESDNPALCEIIDEICTCLCENGISSARQPADKSQYDIAIDFTRAPDMHPESYEIKLIGHSGRIKGPSQKELFYGATSLLQLIRHFKGNLPELSLTDAPAYRNRAYLLDITRGKVPKVERIKALIRDMAKLKYNQLQLYFEHTFQFHFDPDIGQNCNPMSPDDIKELDAYSNDWHVELVPCLACFGHMGHILSLPQYKQFAEIEWDDAPWDDAPWERRMKGCTLNPSDPDAQNLIKNMLNDFLPCFSSKKFNACCDETYDLGRGKNTSDNMEQTRIDLYSSHIQFLNQVTQSYGKQLMVWGDILLQHPAALSKIPNDVTILDWGYEAQMNYDKTRIFTDAGFSTYICPSVRGYKRLFHDLNDAEQNIRNYAKAGIANSATGLMVTDWGDLGHFNTLGCSLFGMAEAAAEAWTPGSFQRLEMDHVFSSNIWKTQKDIAVLYRLAGACAHRDWRHFLSPATESEECTLASADSDAEKIQTIWNELPDENVVPPERVQDLKELRLSVNAIELHALMTKYFHTDSVTEKKAAKNALQNGFREFIEQHERIWLAANRPSRLQELQIRFKSLAERL